ncbi:hypothetical protein [Micavibrio aeruginosavorus]|uniref:Uncharacterized protein n=1 Tax=Micavibrio aeruginosavorus (strain ARL-13) TaxID=856793 RepID=G2KRE9_MICAA|nr:hypothetical protein [Micavibrio aeruginosavorus]AEP09196.1 hypothetical protein MICA_863 [Micavibrio aeruginosavorus ARL-13]
MSNDLSKPSRYIMGVLSVSFLIASATTPIAVKMGEEALDKRKNLSDEAIQAHYADLCLQRDARKAFETSVKTITANGPHTITITADPNSKSVQSCPQKTHEAIIAVAKSANHFNIFAGLSCLVLSGMMGYLALGGGKKKEPKPS